MSKTMPKLSLSFLFLAFLSASSSGTRLGFSYDAATNAAISSTRDTLSFSVFRFPIKAIPMEEAEPNEINREEEEFFRYSHRKPDRKLISATEDDSFIPQSPTTIPQVTPVPNIVTVPSMNPVTMTPLNPATNPLTVPTTAPPTNPVTSPSLVPPVSNQVPPAFSVPMAPPNTGTPITPPVTTPLNPVTPPATTNPPTTSGQAWCVAKTGTPANALQAGLDYACGLGGADCSAIQASGSCYNPNNPQSHASYAFNSYYHKNPVPSSCDFKGAATLVNTNPSSASCIYPSSSSSPAGTPSITSPPATTPTTFSPPPTTPTTLSPPATPTTLSPPATISPPNEPPPTTPTTNTPPATTSPNFPPFMLNSSSPDSPTPAIYGSSPPPGASSSVSTATSMQPLFAPILMVSLVLTGRLCVM